ncbi:cytochrome P450 [Cryphonectria parasitica EP155]|uniref:Cytochrome P450 n=1 Tax=Cryphonectria parasitica (strain ATCC 38755 / EP155) TaxID=660469 RepID=A0A9P5CTJ8_CRYP1|nr:cytochrome P450 [Cryphonectria parasitica EP155]KAF3769506.1 cytochrome P450 [Cryphonectria parasitica EP155]
MVQVQDQPVTALVITFIVICITTRLVTSRSDNSQAKSYIHDAQIPPAVPYWIPYLGHIPQMAFGFNSFLAGLRKLYPGGAFALNFFGGTHNVPYKPSLYKKLFSRPEHVVDGGRASKHLMQSVFGYPRSKADLALYDKILKDLEQQYTHLLSGQSLKQMVKTMTDRLRHNVAEFVTFNMSEIDQVHWERVADAGLVEDATGKEVVEADLFELVRNFVAFTANPCLVGTDFVENFPEFWLALWRLDKGFLSLALDFPAVLPLNKAIGARRARGFLLRSLDEFQASMDTVRNGEIPAPQWADLGNVSPLMQHRVDDVFRKYNLSTKQRSALDLALIWAINANANPVVFWVLWRVYSQPDGLLARIRKEIAPFVVLEKPAIGFGAAFESATRIESIDIEGILNKCPLLKASYIETLRLDFDGWNFKYIREDTVVGDKEGEKFFLRAGTYAHLATQLWNTDPSVYDDPEVWRAERHIRPNATGGTAGQESVIDIGDLRPYGGGEAICNGQDFAVQEVLLFSAALIAMYDIEPVGGGPWKLPRREKSAGALYPTSPARVWIRSRPI